MTLISLHMPKTAGTSFKTALMTHFGAGYQDDYGDVPISKPLAEREASAVSDGLEIAVQGLGRIECIHGHFLPLKYLPLNATWPLIFITWLREPVARLISHYHYWQRSYDAATSAPHHRRVVEQGWTLEQFCLSEQFKNIYTQYLWRFPLENFSFVGISEHYRDDLCYFSERYLSTHLELQHKNAAGKTAVDASLDTDFMARVRDFHADDVLLYQRALQARSARILAAGKK